MRYAAFVVSLLLIIASGIIAIRYASAQDQWMCVDGEWVADGVPIDPMPTEVCAE